MVKKWGGGVGLFYMMVYLAQLSSLTMIVTVSSQSIQSVYYRASVKRDWFAADLLVAQSLENKFWVRAKTFHKTSFCCKNSLRSEINPYHFESPLSGEFFNFIFLQEKDGWQMSPLSTSFPTHWHLIECFSVVLFHFHQNAKEKVNVSVGSINPN